ncbi:LuxR C-terminal-related transcriptional regulator [Kineococcus aurantiacus]|uniref:DNA-binding CsgD family transcriptional regulator n=1 Tax=Kineococcus aurantiacus TaxID=37633 RepID=A0A7Y9DN83_9ACTN|nr:DNA-binding CsgD family transcriptional regulator [Kineococcus aurantiacus]
MPAVGRQDTPGAAAREHLAAAAPVLAHGVDPVRSLLTVARLVRGASAGAVLREDGRTEPVLGLGEDRLLAPGSPVLVAARSRLGAGQVCSSFLWPAGGRRTPGGHVRVTVLTAPDEAPTARAVVLLSPPPELHGLTPRELEVLGLVVDGCSNPEIARTLTVTPRTVAAHVEHVLVKLGAPTRTLAAVRAEREGLYVPPLALTPTGPRAGSAAPA